MVARTKNLNDNQLIAVEAFIARVKQKYILTEAIAFGSAVLGRAEEGSDLDILIVTENKLNHRDRHSIQNMSTETNWEYDTNISPTIVDKDNWEHGMYSILLIKDEVYRYGVTL